ncbi:hypothetical protein SPRA44_470003 [Serratia proteamaculans]|nr:hypothetical protein SPRA44_470003 [Serratia proteamaculans]
MKCLQALGYKIATDIANGTDTHITANVMNTGCITAINFMLLNEIMFMNVRAKQRKINLKNILLSSLFSL